MEKGPWYPWVRLFAFPVGVALLAPAAFVAFVVAVYAGSGLQAPDPLKPDEFMQSTPDTWWEVAGQLAASLVAATLMFAILTVSAGLFWFAFTGRAPRWKILRQLPIGGLGALVLLYIGLLIPLLGHARKGPDCDTFRFDAAAWKSDDYDTHFMSGWGVAKCGVLTGMTKPQVDQLLREQGDDQGGSGAVRYDDISVHFSDGRATKTDRPVNNTPVDW